MSLKDKIEPFGYFYISKPKDTNFIPIIRVDDARLAILNARERMKSLLSNLGERDAAWVKFCMDILDEEFGRWGE